MAHMNKHQARACWPAHVEPSVLLLLLPRGRQHSTQCCTCKLLHSSKTDGPTACRAQVTGCL